LKVKLIHNKYYTLDIFNCSPSIVYFKEIDGIKLDIV
jgi:hypothetical protein